MPKLIDITGERYGRLTVIKLLPRQANGSTRWLCRCDCGTLTEVYRCNLTRGHVTSCGCYARELATRHGLATSRVYNIWIQMKHRCENPKCHAFRYYGSRGIKLCDRWQSFDFFLEDMRQPPSNEHSIDRIDNSGNYEPSNCRWATRTEQARNKRNNRFITVGNETKTLSEWALIAGVSSPTIIRRLEDGWPPEKAVSTPRYGTISTLITFDGRTQSISAWIEELGVPKTVVYRRLKKGWAVERAVSTPSKGKNKPAREPTS